MLRSRLLASGLIAACILLVYHGVFGNGFITFFDDRKYILDNFNIQRGFGFQSLLWAFTSKYASNWHPVTWLSHMLDWSLFGSDPRGHHGINLLIHLINSILLFHILRRFTGAHGRSLVVALLFAVHPLHVESVAWVSERKDLLSGFFALATLYLYADSEGNAFGWKRLAALCTFILGLMAKPMLVTLPVLMLFLDYWPLRLIGRGTRILPLVREKVPFFVLSIFSALVTLWAQGSGGAIAAADRVPLSFRVINALEGYLQYIWKTVCPVDLAVFYPLPASVSVAAGVGAGCLLAVISWCAWRFRRSAPEFIFGWSWYLVSLLPVIGFIQVGRQAMADRYTYLPSIGLFVIGSWGLSRIGRPERVPAVVRTAVSAVILVALMFQAWSQVGYWKNSITLFSHAATVVPGSYLAELNLGKALAEEGRNREALEAFAACRSLRPSLPEPELEMGNVLLAEGRVGEAIERYETALRLHRDAVRREGVPENAELYYDLGLAYGISGNLSRSIEYLAWSVRVNPRFAEAQYNLGIAYVKRGDAGAGIERLRAALAIKPDFPEAAAALERALSITSPGK